MKKLLLSILIIPAFISAEPWVDYELSEEVIEMTVVKVKPGMKDDYLMGIKRTWVDACNIQKDLNKITKSETKLRFIKKFSVEPDSLNINTSSRKLSKPNEVLCFDGFRSICPVTSQPDFAKIYIYTNAKVDINPIKRFLVSFKEKGEFHEQCIEYIFADLQNKYPDYDFEICGRFLRRGGIDINPIRSSKKKLFFKNFRAFNQ